MIHCFRSFCLVKSRGFAHPVALALVSMMLCHMSVKECYTSRLYRDAQAARRDKSCPART